eukprot:14809723-Ditylum_brightwellii.AAC.1
MIEKHLYPSPCLPPDEAWAKCINETHLDWGEEKELYSFEITDEDTEIMAQEVTLPTIELVLEMISSGNLPSLDTS